VDKEALEVESNTEARLDAADVRAAIVYEVSMFRLGSCCWAFAETTKAVAC
jgi:hypothetical protein